MLSEEKFYAFIERGLLRLQVTSSTRWFGLNEVLDQFAVRASWRVAKPEEPSSNELSRRYLSSTVRTRDRASRLECVRGRNPQAAVHRRLVLVTPFNRRGE